MPVHDWTRVDAGIFHAFHHDWITEIARSLNRGRLPAEYYALPEQFAAGFGPDVLTLQSAVGDDPTNVADAPPETPSGGGVLLAAPKLRPVAETDLTFYRRRQKAIVIRHVSGDRIVAMLEIVSPGNKAARNPLRALVRKAADLLAGGVHLLIVDLFPPGRRDPEGIHGEIWQEIAGKEASLPADKPLTLAAYEAGDMIRAYVVNLALREPLTDMPLFLEPGQAVTVPLEQTYLAAFADTPNRWRRVLDGSLT